MTIKKDKLVVIGAGYVGTAIAYTAMCRGIFSEIVIIDINKNKAEGEALDMMHGVSFVSPCSVKAGDYTDCKGADIVMITAGAAQKPGETRHDLLSKNAKIFKSIVIEAVKYCPKKTIFMVVTNPCDPLAYMTWKISGFPKHRVIGTGTVLDTSRFKYALSEHTKIDPRDIDAYILGEHGDSEVPVWSKTTIAGLTVPEYCDICGKCGGKKMTKIFDSVRNAAYEIINKKGHTSYAIALSANKIAEAILFDSNSILTVSVCPSGEYGLEDVYISVPAVINSKGVASIPELPLTRTEYEGLMASAKIIKKDILEAEDVWRKG